MALKTLHIVQGLSRTPLLFIPRYLTNILFEHILQKENLENRQYGNLEIQKPRFTNRSPGNEEDIRAGYQDVLHYDGNANGAPVLYIGAWKDDKPHGEGQIFWHNGTPAFKGEMRNGKMWKGYLIDERSRVHGNYRFSYDGDRSDVKLDGFQPGDGDDEEGIMGWWDTFPFRTAPVNLEQKCFLLSHMAIEGVLTRQK